MTPPSPNRPAPLWLHVWAIVTVVAVTPLLVLGGQVTSTGSGMADPDWPTYPWHLLIHSWQIGDYSYLIEHSHRAVGYFVGCCVIVLALGLWLRARARRLAWAGTAALLAVIAQGVLGGMRVKLNGTPWEPLLEAVHGAFAPLVFSLLAALAALTAPRREGAALQGAHARRCVRITLVLAALVYAQIVLGVLVRHLHEGAAQRLHVLAAFGVVAALVWFLRTAWEEAAGRRAIGLTAVVLAALVVVQLALGVEAWIAIAKQPSLEASAYMAGTHAEASTTVRTLHVLVGACVLAMSVVAAVQALRAAAPEAVETEPEPTPAPAPVVTASHHLKGTA